jgi:hypothetical protein
VTHRLRCLLTAALALGAFAALTSPAFALQQRLTAADGTAGTAFGNSVAIDGDTIAVGSFLDGGGKGAVYVFQRSGDTWNQTGKLTASDGAAGDNLGWSVAIDGDTVVAGAKSADVGADTDEGAVYTFSRTGPATRTETAKLTFASGGGPGDALGSSVAIDGETIAAGAFGTNANAGTVVTFARSGAPMRTPTAYLFASGGVANDDLGTSVAINGDTIVAGAPQVTVGSNIDQGALYTFTSTGALIRNETAELTASDGAGTDFMGFRVAIDAGGIVAGVDGADIGANANQGAVYTFARTGAAARTQTAKLTASDGASSDSFGSSVAIDGPTILAGARRDDVGSGPTGINQGSAYTFASTGPAIRTETSHLTAADPTGADDFGYSAALDGTTMVIGAPGDEIGANTGQGSVTVFFAAAPTPDTTPPETTFTKRPKNKIHSSKAKYKFTSNEPGSSFKCRVDKQKRFKPCSSPRKLKHLKAGRHSFQVEAIDASGNADRTPAKDRFRVVQ